MSYMNRAAIPFKKENSYHGIPVIHTLYLLLILIAPFAGINLVFLLSITLFLAIRFSGNYINHYRDVISLCFSLSLMLFVSFISGNSSYTYPLYIVFAAFAVAAVGNHNHSFVEKEYDSDFKPKFRRIKRRSFSIFWSAAVLGIRIVAAFLAACWIVYWGKISVSYNMVFFIAVIGAVTGSLFESIPSRIERNISSTIGCRDDYVDL